MKTSKLLASVFGTVAIAGVVQFSTTNAAVACPISKMLPLKSYNAGIWTAAGTAGLFGLGALYLTWRDSENTADGAGIDGTGDGNEHPEAPGGEFALSEALVKSEQPEVVAEDKSEKEITLV